MRGSLPVLATGLDEGAGVALAVVVAASAGALIATLVRVPKPAGYLIAGAALGPAALGWVDDREQVTAAADIGVALLLFAVGLELSLQELARTLRAALIIGLGEALVVGVATVGLAPAMDVSATGALVLGGAIALSSTAAGVAVIVVPGSRVAALASVAVGVLIVQDVLAIVIIALVPTLDTAGLDVLATALIGAALAIVGLLAVLPVAAAVTRAAVHALADQVDRELFLVATLAGVGGAAAGVALVGLSPAVGAFVAGLLIRQSGYARQALRETGGLRDVFAAVFFVSVGLLFEPDVVRSDGPLVGVLLAMAIGVKFVAVAGLARLAGLPWKAGLLLGAVLANAGEFSYVAAEAANGGVLTDRELSAIVFVVVVSLVVSTLGAGARRGRDERLVAGEGTKSVVVVGYGRVGKAVANALRGEGFRVMIIEQDADAAGEAKADGFSVTWGDARQRRVLARTAGAAATVVTPAGTGSAEVLDALAACRPGARAVCVSMPAGFTSLGLDLTVVDVDRRVGDDFAAVVGAAVGLPIEPYTVRTAGGTARFQAPRRQERKRRREWLAEAFPWAGPRPGECRACRGTGRRYSWPVATTCPACRGLGRSG